MTELVAVQKDLNRELFSLASRFQYRWDQRAKDELCRTLFLSLALKREDYLYLLFGDNYPEWPGLPRSLREAQGAKDGAEYTEAARGTTCGHIFKAGESTYACKTCAVDDTCVLCTRCFESTDHEGHQYYISASPGNSGCCDCGDKEAWKTELVCSIHSDLPGAHGTESKDKGKVAQEDSQTSTLPKDLVDAIRMTIARCMDFFIDVVSCSPEQMRLTKSERSVKDDERLSQLSNTKYDVTGEEVTRMINMEKNQQDGVEYALILWNDEKHSIDDVTEQVAKACRVSRSQGLKHAQEVNDVGRSIIMYSRNLPSLLRMAKIIEELKLTATIRSSRDTFQEQMCETIIAWFTDIAPCSVGHDTSILRTIICEELLNSWRTGSRAGNRAIARQGLDDHEWEDAEIEKQQRNLVFMRGLQTVEGVELEDEADGDVDDQDPEDDEYEDTDAVDDETMELEVAPSSRDDEDSMDVDATLEELDNSIAAMAAEYFAPPLPLPPRLPPPRLPTPPQVSAVPQPMTYSEGYSTEERSQSAQSESVLGAVPKTPSVRMIRAQATRKPSRHWLETPEGFKGRRPYKPSEDLWQRVRLDWLIMYDLRLWKTLRVSLRHLYISTVVSIPQFKRILGLRFAVLHTLLAELYLIADREPDHSIINLSVQILTTPSVTEEVVERCNFLTNLMATLYTFLTTRQVGYPQDVNPKASLALDSGTVTNRRVFHFFVDLRWLFQSEYVRGHIRTEPRYLLQFLDLAKLHQGICPNVRATGEHVEYESDAWISASLIIKEINKLCRHISLSFKRTGKPEDDQHLLRAVRNAAQVAVISSFGFERRRFHQAELKSDLIFHTIGPFMIESSKVYKVPKYVVQTESMSFHHPLHYLLSWLIESANALDRTTARKLLTFTPADFKDPFNNVRNAPPTSSGGLSQDQILAGLLDPPLRVCAWLSQTKAGMWVRNGITLRHQANSYRSVVNRDTGYQRDILLVQTGLTLIGKPGEEQGEAYLAQMIDRFEMTNWMTGDYSTVRGFEESQQLDVLEDIYHLLVIALSERGHLTPQTPENIAQEQRQPSSLSDRILQHDIAHALCFKPLPYSDLTGRVTEKVCDAERFSTVLSSMTTYKAPEGLSDTGTFELKPEYIELVDPYYAHYSRNLREEAENVYRKYMSRKTGKRPEDVVYEPRLERIECGIFQDLAGFTRSGLFAQVLFAALDFAQTAHLVSNLPLTRIETFLHMVLHLTQIALLEEINSNTRAFTTNAATDLHQSNRQKTSIVKTLMVLAEMSSYATCRPTINHILHKMLQRQPERLSGFAELAHSLDRAATGSPASLSVDEREKKKQEALARQARVMARFQQQQESFLRNQKLEGLEIDDDFEDADDAMSITQDDAAPAHEVWHFPCGTCILCQEETNDQRLYGTFTYLAKTDILRTTPIDDEDYINEVRQMPEDFDRAYNERPYGVAGNNKSTVTKTNAAGEVTQSVRYSLSKGFPQAENSFESQISTSCGHIMHFNCFELYFAATIRRHQSQIARNHPETVVHMEFICPLCKALGNTFLPIVWKSKDCISSNVLTENESVESWITQCRQAFDEPNQQSIEPSRLETLSQRSKAYVAGMFMPSLATSMSNLTVAASEEQHRHRRDVRGIGGIRLFGLPEPLHFGRQPDPSSSDTGISKAYLRARETVTNNDLDPTFHSDPGPIGLARVLARALATTISATEIASRGVATTGGGSLLSGLSEQTVTHLRILAESFESHYCVEVLRSDNRRPSTMYQLLVQQDIIRSALLPGKGSHTQGMCIAGDMFLFFNDWLAFFNPDQNEAFAVMQICLWAEIVKVMLAYRHWVRTAPQDAAPVTPQFEKTVFDIYRTFGQNPVGQHEATAPMNLTMTCALGHLRVLIDRYALAYLRKCLILMHIRYGFTFNDKHSSGPELDRIIQLLHIAPISHWFDMFTSDTVAGERVRTMTEYWTMVAGDFQETGDPFVIKMGHPAIFELVGLPKNFDILTEAAIHRRCPTTGKELTDPVCCLFCGEIFCSQAFCCMRLGRGGCGQHMRECASGKIGIFINIRKCMMLFLNGDNGSWVNAPYLDAHGEADPTLRRHHQLFLNQRRYDKLMREVWLQHGVQNVISRKLEGDNNPGGWETL